MPGGATPTTTRTPPSRPAGVLPSPPVAAIPRPPGFGNTGPPNLDTCQDTRAQRSETGCSMTLRLRVGLRSLLQGRRLIIPNPAADRTPVPVIAVAADGAERSCARV